MEKKQKQEDDRIIPVREHDLHKLKERSSKIKEMEKLIEKTDAQMSELKDRYLRTAAEFDNYKKRTDREKQDIFRFGTENLIMQLLPFDDIFESVMKQLEKNPSPELIHKGMEMLKREFTKFLENSGVKKIETKGKRFNPEFHEASATVEADEEEGTIVDEDRSGYMFHDRVLRPAMVKVAKKPPAETIDNENSGTGEN